MKKPKIYTRKVIGGGIKLYQFIVPRLVFTLSSNSSRSNGKIEKNVFTIRSRSKTNL